MKNGMPCCSPRSSGQYSLLCQRPTPRWARYQSYIPRPTSSRHPSYSRSRKMLLLSYCRCSRSRVNRNYPLSCCSRSHVNRNYPRSSLPHRHLDHTNPCKKVFNCFFGAEWIYGYVEWIYFRRWYVLCFALLFGLRFPHVGVFCCSPVLFYLLSERFPQHTTKRY